jgi:hypothetical protein
MSNYARMLIERLGKPDFKTGIPLDQTREEIGKQIERRIHYAGIDGAESVNGCENMAYLLFMIIREQHGDRTARRIFAKWGTPPTTRRLKFIANLGLLDRLDRMKPKPSVQRLARELAAENKGLPLAERKAAGGINPIALEKLIRRTRDLRVACMKKGTWTGPFPDTD